jgi:glycosyltransferase involved in cell wall biosynthesis
MINPTITAVVITKNEQDMIEACLDCLQWCTEILVIDNGSIDLTPDLAEKKGAKVVSFKHDSFSRIRSEALKIVTTDWLVYIDADERVTPDLAKEIAVNIETRSSTALTFVRHNYFFGEKFEFGGWEADTVTRAFQKSSLIGWHGKVHETPEFTGDEKVLSFPLIHFSHRSVVSGLYKSAAWTPMEAELLFKANEPTVTFQKILKKGVSEFIKRAIMRKGYKDGQAGLVEALIQGINRMLVYMQVWELQQKPPIEKKYSNLEKHMKEKWLAT